MIVDISHPFRGELQIYDLSIGQVIDAVVSANDETGEVTVFDKIINEDGSFSYKKKETEKGMEVEIKTEKLDNICISFDPTSWKNFSPKIKEALKITDLEFNKFYTASVDIKHLYSRLSCPWRLERANQGYFWLANKNSFQYRIVPAQNGWVSQIFDTEITRLIFHSPWSEFNYAVDALADKITKIKYSLI